MNSIQIKYVKEHVEVYAGTCFLFSADNYAEAIRELKAQMINVEVA